MLYKIGFMTGYKTNLKKFCLELNLKICCSDKILHLFYEHNQICSQ